MCFVPPSLVGSSDLILGAGDRGDMPATPFDIDDCFLDRPWITALRCRSQKSLRKIKNYELKPPIGHSSDGRVTR